MTHDDMPSEKSLKERAERLLTNMAQAVEQLQIEAPGHLARTVDRLRVEGYAYADAKQLAVDTLSEYVSTATTVGERVSVSQMLRVLDTCEKRSAVPIRRVTRRPIDDT
ncbi:hypothetical protein CMK11_08550 [Candidatus Poribacteria bacterium]|nr:hypothetical protein [Candidatus Poribacteria bacterium]